MAEVRAVDVAGPDAVRAVAAARAVDPGEVLGVEDLWQMAARDPRHVVLLATEDGVDAAVAELGPILSWDEPHGMWLRFAVLPGHHATAGAALWDAVAAHCARHGVTLLRGGVPEDQPETLRLLAAGGVHEVERSQRVVLRIPERPPDPEPPAGVALRSLADDPALLDDLVALDAETIPDIPGEGAVAQGQGWWEDLLADGSFDPRTIILAVAEGRGVSMCALRHHRARPDVAVVDYTATARAWRGRGLAVLVKRACHAAAWDVGVREIRAWNHLDNAPMRAVNARLGYERASDAVTVRGDLPPAA
ncbi:MAG: GNAT family N-acetyltransferase [Thermoleophilia bacterium]